MEHEFIELYVAVSCSTQSIASIALVNIFYFLGGDSLTYSLNVTLRRTVIPNLDRPVILYTISRYIDDYI